MIKNYSLKQQLLLSVLSVIICGMGLLYYFSYNNLKNNIDTAQELLYTQKIDNIIYFIEQKYQKLQKTQMQVAYEDIFKKGTIETIKSVYQKDNKEELYPFIIDSEKHFILHKRFTKKNSNLYKDDENFLKIIQMKNGNFNLVNKKDDRWVVFKYYKAWDWIIGYRVHNDVKYMELYKFRDDFIISLILVLIIISLIIIFIVRKILYPVNRLIDLSKKISSGNFDIKIETSGANELKDLANNFEIMRDKIVKDIKKLEENERKINNFNIQLKKEVEDRTNDLLEQKNSFETLFKDSSDGLSLLKENKFVDCNKALLEILGFKNKEEFLNLTPYDLSPKFQADGRESEEKANYLIKKCLDEGSISFEWVHLRANKEPFWAEILLTKILINHEVILYAVWRDIQDKKELEIQIKNKNFDLQESNDELEKMIDNLKKTQNKLIESEKLAGLGSLVAAVAHEINTPVGIGLTGSSHLEYLNEVINEKYKNDEMSKEEFEEYLKSSNDLVKVINSNLNRTADIVRNFKQVSADQTSEQKRVFRFKEYIRGILVSIDSIIKKRDLEINIDCDDSLEIVSYPGFFAQIVTNLVSNSINHAFDEKESGKISFSIKRKDNLLTFLYSDNGKGILEKNLSKIYEPFFSTNKEGGGSGLGLNIVYNLVTTNLKGTIECESKINEGTIFIIRVPIDPSDV